MVVVTVLFPGKILIPPSLCKLALKFSSSFFLSFRFCYYCLRTRCAAVNSYRCARCNEPVVAIQRYGASETRASTQDESRESTNQGS